MNKPDGISQQEYTATLTAVVKDMVANEDLSGLFGVVALELLELRVQMEAFLKIVEIDEDC